MKSLGLIKYSAYLYEKSLVIDWKQLSVHLKLVSYWTKTSTSRFDSSIFEMRKIQRKIDFFIRK